MRAFLHSLCGRSFALALCALSGPLACIPQEILDVQSGLRDYQTPGLVPVPGGFVNASGGNLVLIRTDLTIDTPLGTQALTATYNSASGRWRWSHQMTYDGSSFVDPSGATFDLSGVPDGSSIDGTIWERIDASAIQTKGGLSYRFAPDGSLEQVRWSTLDYPRLTFTPGEIAHCVAAVACAPIFILTSNSDGQPLTISDARTGRQAQFAYDTQGRLVAAKSPTDVALGRPGTRYEYGGLGTLLTASVSSENERVVYTYAPGRRIAAVTQIGEESPQYVFRYFGKTASDRFPTLHINPLGGRTRYSFDPQRRLLQIDREDASEATEVLWSGLRPTREVGPDGAVTEFAFEDDRLVSRTEPSGNVVRFEYAPAGLNLEAPAQPALSRREDALGLLEEHSYDAQGRAVASRNGALEESTRSFAGTSVDATTQLGSTTDFPVFGVHGHWLAAVVAGNTVSTRAFDPVGDVIVPSPRLREGGVLARTRDADRRLATLSVTHSDDAGHVGASGDVSISRRSDGQISLISRPGGGDHAFDYDSIGRLVGIRERVDGVWQVTSVEYDAAGLETARQRANGMREEYEYDSYGRMTQHRALRSGVLEGTASFTWSAGRLIARYDSVRDESEIFAYDAAGRWVGTTFGHGESISREYDLRGRLTAEAFALPGVGVVADLGYECDAAGRLVRLVDRGSGEVLVDDVWTDGLPRSTARSNGLVRSYAYDAQARLIGMETRDAAGAIVESTAISRTTELDPVRLAIVSATSTPLASSREEYWLPAGVGLVPPDQRVGKRLFAWNDGMGSETTYAWDWLGNPAATSVGDAFTTNTEGNRLLSASLADEGEIVDYAYDAAGFVVVRDGVFLAWTATGRLAALGTDQLVWDMGDRLVEATIEGVTREFRLFGGRVESSLTSLGTLDLGVVSIHLGTGELRHRHPDFRGNVSFVSDDNASIVAHHRYGPFGVDVSWGPDAGGVSFERRTGFGPLVLMGARVLDPLIGRFLSPDPRLQPLNQYSYALGNPIWFEDRDGRQMAPRRALEVGMMIAAIAVGAFVLGAIVLGAPAVYIAAVGAAYAVTYGVVTAALLVDEFRPVKSGGSPTVRSPASPPPPPDPPAPKPGGDAPAAPQLKLLVLEAGFAPSCTPLAAAVPWGRSPRTAVFLLIANGLIGFAWLCFRRKEVA